MNREIKFRVWDVFQKKFLNYPCYFNNKDFNEFTAFDRYFKCDEDECIVQQYTGLKDKNGKEIYEGDIVNFTKRGITHGPEAEDIKNDEVWYSSEDCAFVFGKYKSTDYTWWYSMTDDLYDFVVVGNIYENKDLLK